MNNNIIFLCSPRWLIKHGFEKMLTSKNRLLSMLTDPYSAHSNENIQAWIISIPNARESQITPLKKKQHLWISFFHPKIIPTLQW